MKRAFTLIEMLVVIGIVAVLAGVLMKVSSGGLEAARNTKCIANLRMLAAGVVDYCDKHSVAHVFPLAGSVMDADYRSGGGYIRPGWIGTGSQSTIQSCYNQSDDVRRRAIDEGSLFRYVNYNRDIFVCPVHKRTFRHNPPLWSYAMNSFFGWDVSEGGAPVDATMLEVPRGKLIDMLNSPLERILLFAEINYTDYIMSPNTSSGNDTETDCTLQYEKKEIIGFNHVSGSDHIAHVAFCDGHVEKLMWPHGASPDEAVQLTEWLCQGKDVAFNGEHFENLKE